MFVDEGEKDDYENDPIEEVEKEGRENRPKVEWLIKGSTAVNTTGWH